MIAKDFVDRTSYHYDIIKRILSVQEQKGGNMFRGYNCLNKELLVTISNGLKIL